MEKHNRSHRLVQEPEKQASTILRSIRHCGFLLFYYREPPLQALEYASQFADISEQEKSIIMHTSKSLLFDNNKPWCKKNNANMFEVTMGSFDGAEVCELVGLLILSKLKCEFNNKYIGLYRDDGLAVFRNMGPRSTDNLTKRITKCFDTLGLKITIQSNLKIVNYLDVTFNLANMLLLLPLQKSGQLAYVHQCPFKPPAINH